MKHLKRLRFIKILFAIVVVLLLFVPASVNHPQIDMRALVAALGLDIAENSQHIEVSVEIILPVEGGGSVGSSEVVSGFGKSLAEALNSISVSLGRSLELNHCGIIVLGQSYAKSGVTADLEYLLSSGMVCPEINLTVSANESANEFLQALSDYSQKLDLSNLLRYTDLGVQNYSCALVRFLRDCRSASATSIVPCFKMGYHAENTRGLDESKKQNGGESAQDEGSSDENQQDKKQALVENAQMTAVFVAENGLATLKKILPNEEAYGLAWLDSRTKKGYVFVDNLHVNGQTLNNLPLAISSKSITRRASYSSGKARFVVNAKVKLTVEDRHSINHFANLKNGAISNEAKNALKEKASQIIADSIVKAYESAKEADADVMLIEDMFFRFCHRDYKKLKRNEFDFLKNTEFVVKCSVSIN